MLSKDVKELVDLKKRTKENERKIEHIEPIPRNLQHKDIMKTLRLYVEESITQDSR